MRGTYSLNVRVPPLLGALRGLGSHAPVCTSPNASKGGCARAPSRDADSAPLLTSLSRNADAVAAAAQGGKQGIVAAGPLAVWGSLRHSLPRGPTRGTRRELTKWGEVGAGGGTPGSRRRARSSHPNWKEPVPPGADAEPPQPRAPRVFSRGTLSPPAPSQSLDPPGAGGTGRWERPGAAGKEAAPGPRARPARGAGGEGAGAPSTPALPAVGAAKRPGPVGPARKAALGWGERGGGPGTPAAGAGVAQRDPAVGSRPRRRYLQ